MSSMERIANVCWSAPIPSTPHTLRIVRIEQDKYSSAHHYCLMVDWDFGRAEPSPTEWGNDTSILQAYIAYAKGRLEVMARYTLSEWTRAVKTRPARPRP